MREELTGILGVIFALSMSGQIPAQTKGVDPLPEGDVYYISASDIAARSTGPLDGMLGVKSINKGEYSVGTALINRPKTPEGKLGGGLEYHLDITEVYQIISGHGTFVYGGTLVNKKPEIPANPRLGPGFSGTSIEGGTTIEVGPGDVIMIPPLTPHWWKQIQSDHLVYTNIRIDPHHVLSMPPPA